MMPSKIIPIHPVPATAGTGARPLYDKQAKVYPRSVTGWFASWRWLMVWVTQAVFYGLPWLAWNGRQAVLFDLTERRFFVFGLLLHPQDFIYLAALLVIAALALFFFTAVAGRLWCGYACPQTVYTEIFLWVERQVEGDRTARMRLDASPWSLQKLARKGGKQALWLAISLFTGFTFVGYFTPIHTLAHEVALLSFSPWEWFWVLFYGFATYGNAGYMREQVCKFMCPYARFQSALIDMDSLVIAYDAARGESRGSRSRKTDPRSVGLGDCIDCTLCVQVCPTGIDIRNGLQNECIACAACIDVCDDVMGKMGYAKGLIRYSSGNGMAAGLPQAGLLRNLGRPRVVIYGGLLLAAGTAFALSLSLRTDFGVDVIRDRGVLARQVSNGFVENVYQLRITNSSESEQHYHIQVSGLPDLRIVTPADATVPAAGLGSVAVRLELPPAVAESYKGHAVPVVFEISSNQHHDVQTRQAPTTFFVPR